MLPYQTAVAMDYAVSSSLQRQAAAAASSSNLGVGLGMNINPAFAHSWFVPADLCVPYKQNQNPLLEPGILELRKEKSRDAARSRRGKENFEFYELAKLLPLPAAITSQLDKASIIRLTISYLKLRQFSESGDPIWSRSASQSNKASIRNRSSSSSSSLSTDVFDEHQGTHILQSLDGFALALAADGRFLYISETVSIYLGLSQVEMTGSSVFDYVHAEDHNELADHLGLGLTMNSNLASPNSNTSEDGTSGTIGTHNPDVSTLMSLSNNSTFGGYDRAFCIRMKSTLTKRGCHFKTSGFRVVLVLCKLRPEYPFTPSRKTSVPILGMVGIAIALPPPSVHEMRLDSDMFVTRINFDFKIAHCEPRVPGILDYTAEELVGKSLYSLCHGEDVNKLRTCHVDLIKKGQVLTHYYRLMNKYGGYTWIQTCATVVCNTKNADEQTIICVNYLISAKEFKSVVMDCCQLHESDNSVKVEQANSNDHGSRSPDKDSSADGNNNSGTGNHIHDNNTGPVHSNNVITNNNKNNIQITTATSMESNEMFKSNEQTKNHIDAQQSNSSISSRSPSSSLSSSPISVASSLPLINKTSKSPLIDNSTNSKLNESTIGKRKFFKVVDDETDSSTNGEGSLRKKNLLNCDNNNSNDSNNNNNNSINSGRTIKNDTDKDKDMQNNTTVKDLENAMSKHLPKKSNDVISLPQTTDFSTDALLKQQDRATIQWIGAHHHQHNSSTNTASVLLRQLYANRESVIRANVQGNYSNAANIRSVVPTAGSSPYFVNDQHGHSHGHGPLPTSPDSDAATFNENQFVLHHHHHHHHQKSLAAAANDTFNALISYSTPSTYAAAAAVAAAADYHSAMTPPSSVSPREKHQLLHNNMTPFDNSVYNDVLRHPYFSNSNTNNVAASTNAAIENSSTLPLKSQLYMTSGVPSNAFDAATAAAVCAAAGSIEQSQFYHHNTTRSSFHHFYKSNASTSNWYSH